MKGREALRGAERARKCSAVLFDALVKKGAFLSLG